MINIIIKFKNDEENIFYIFILSLIFSLIYILTNNIPELFLYGKELMDFIFSLVISLLAALIFYIFQVYIPENRKEKEQMLRLDKIISPYFSKIIVYSNFMTNADNNSNYSIEENFNFKKLENFSVTSMNVTDIPKKSCYLLNKNIIELKGNIKNALLNYNFNRNSNLEKLFIDYIYNSKNIIPEFLVNVNSLSPEILEILIDMIAKIKENTIPKYTEYPGNLFINIIMLYDAINFNIKFINKYNSIIKEFKK